MMITSAYLVYLKSIHTKVRIRHCRPCLTIAIATVHYNHYTINSVCVRER